MLTKDFITAGHAIFTVELPPAFAEANKLPPHYTYRVSFKRGDGVKWKDAYFIALLTGPNNEHDYSYLGLLIPETGEVRLTAKSPYKWDSRPVEVLWKTLRRVWAGEQEIIEQHGFKLHHEGMCGKCGAKLTTPASVESGLGPVCGKRLQARKQKREENRISFEISERPGFDLNEVDRLRVYRDAENEITHWEGVMNGVAVTIYND